MNHFSWFAIDLYFQQCFCRAGRQHLQCTAQTTVEGFVQTIVTFLTSHQQKQLSDQLFQPRKWEETPLVGCKCMHIFSNTLDHSHQMTSSFSDQLRYSEYYHELATPGRWKCNSCTFLSREDSGSELVQKYAVSELYFLHVPFTRQVRYRRMMRKRFRR